MNETAWLLLYFLVAIGFTGWYCMSRQVDELLVALMFSAIVFPFLFLMWVVELMTHEKE